MLSFLTLATFALGVSGSPAKLSGCTVQNPASLMNLPTGFPAPTESLSYVAVAMGTQNYTCSDAGTYTAAGALAELFDISCLADDPLIFNYISEAAIVLWGKALPKVTPQEVISDLSTLKNPVVLGQHYYVTNPITHSGISPKWDFTSSGATAGDPNAYVVAASAFSSPSPAGSQDITWVYLKNIGAGELADAVYRTDTQLGQPPSSCSSPGTQLTVKYAAKYWLFGGSVKQ